MEEPGDRSAARAAARTGTAHTVAVRVAFEEARQRFASLLEQNSSTQPLLVAVFQQLEACLTTGEQLEERQWRHLRSRLAARWLHRSEAACRPRTVQLASRRRLLAEQQQQLDGLLAEARRQLQLTAAPPTDVPSRLMRKWDRIRSVDRDEPAPEEAEGEAKQQQGDAAAPPQSTLKPWLIEGLTLEEACDKQRLLERSRQLDADTAWLQELRDTQYRAVTDYSHCLQRYFSCVEKSKNSTNELMKTRASLRLHAAWVRDHHLRLVQQQQQQQQAVAPSSDPMKPSAELQLYDHQWEEGLQVETTTAGAGVGAAAAAPAAPPLAERLLYSKLDAIESRTLVSEAAERGSWYEVEFALAHDRLSLTADCVVAMFVCCRCRGRCACQWTRLALAAQRRVPERPARTRGWAWRKLRMATKLIGLLHSTQVES